MVIKKRKVLAIILVLFLGASLRLNQANFSELDIDESDYVNVAVFYSQNIKQGSWFKSFDSNPHPVFYKFVYGLAIAVKDGLGSSLTNLLALRHVSIFFSLIKLFLLSLLNPVAGLLLAVHPLEIKYSSEVYLESLPSLLLLLGLMMLPRKKRSFFSAFFLGMSLAGKYIYGVLGYLIAVVFLIWKKEQILKKIAVFTFVFLISFFIFNPILWQNPLFHFSKSASFFFDYAGQQEHSFWGQFFALSGINLDNTSKTFIGIETFIFVYALFGLKQLFQKLVFFIWFVIAGLFLLFWSVKHPQYNILIITPLCLSAGYFIQNSLWFFFKSPKDRK